MSKTTRFYLVIAASSLFIATTLMAGLRLVAQANGWHSTAAIWLAFFNFPGVIFLTPAEGSFDVGFAIVTNAALYFLIMELVQTLKKPC